MEKSSSSARRGFTLIELLVVIAIIGILSSVVLASLNTARNKGADAAIKSNLDNARAQAELYYDDHGGYGASNALCTAADGIKTMVEGAESAAGGAANATCGSSATAWAAAGKLKADSGNSYCVDSTGASMITATALADGTTVCTKS